MRELFLMRHAKSSWENPQDTDFERPLNQRGMKAAPFMGDFLRNSLKVPKLIISSPATRAKQTANLVREAARIKSEIEFQREIYEASPLTLLKITVEIPNSFKSVLLVGHNPGFELFLNLLTGEHHRMPTAAIAKLSLNIKTWKDAKANCGILDVLLLPKELMKGVNEL